MGHGEDAVIVKQAIWIITSSILALVIAMAYWSTSVQPTPPDHRVFVDTTGELALPQILSNRYANRFIPASPGPLSLPAEGALWLRIPLPANQAMVFELDNTLISDVQGYLLEQGDVEEQPAPQRLSAPDASMPYPWLVLPMDTTGMLEPILYVRLFHEHGLTTRMSLSGYREASILHGNYQASQGVLAGLLLGLMLYSLLQGLLGRDPAHLLMALAAALLALGNLSHVSWAIHLLPTQHGRVGEWFGLAAFPVLGFMLLCLERKPALQIRVLCFGLAAASLLAGLALAWWRPWFEPLWHLVRLGLPLAGIVLGLQYWLNSRRLPVTILLGHLLLIGSWYAESRMVLHPVGETVAGFLIWAALVMFSLGLYVNQRRRAQARSAKHNQEITRQAERRAKADFLARISHEIRTPMNGVLGMTELLLDTALSAKQRDFVQTIHGSGNDLLNLVNEILDMSRLESGQMLLERVQFDLHALINDCLNIFRGRVDGHAVELIGYVNEDIPRTVLGDPARLRQILMALLNNALRFTEQGEIVLVVGLEKGLDSPQTVRFAVQDTGSGMPREARDTLLRGDSPAPRMLDQGDGNAHLGLVIARQLVTMMGGKLGVKHQPGQGNTIWLSLPIESVEANLAEEADGHCLKDRSVLIVDDNATCRKVLQQQTNAWGMNAQTAASGKEALAMLRSQASLVAPFDFLLIDQAMPGMSGLELAGRIKDDPALNSDLITIMLTGMSQPPSRIVARNAGIRRLLNKPVAGYTLRNTLIDEWTQQSNRTEAPSSAEELFEPVPEASGEVFRVLVAEDNAISTKVIRGMLSKLKVEAGTVSNGRQAVEAVRNGAYDMVLMDCEMPEMDGFDAAREIRAWEQATGRHPVPIIALTAHILPEHRERARHVGMNGHMAKPVDLIQLREQLEFWTRRKASSFSSD